MGRGNRSLDESMATVLWIRKPAPHCQSILLIAIPFRGEVRIPHNRMTKNMLGNIGKLFVKYMQQVTTGHLYHLFGRSDFYEKQRALSQFCETSANITNWVTDPFKRFCELLCKVCG